MAWRETLMGHRRLALFGVLVAASRLLLLPFAHKVPIILLSTIADFLLVALVTVAAWQASRRSAHFARMLWLCVAFALALETANAGAGALMMASHGIAAALSFFWKSTIIFYLIWIALTIPLLLSEDDGRAGIDWLRTLDIAQIAIVGFCAYLIFYYFPMLGASESHRVQQFMVLHWLRDGFLAAGFFYRGFRSQARALRRLLLSIALFFAIFTATGSMEIYFFEKAALWQVPILDFVADLPFLFLLFLATSWQESMESKLAPGSQERNLFWTQLLPVLVPALVILLAAQIPGEQMRLAWIAVGASVACYAGRLMVMQHRQEAAQRTLLTLEEEFSTVFKVSPAAITVSRLSDGRYLEVNDRWLEMAKLSRDEVIGKTSVELGFWSDATQRKVLLEAVQKTGTARDLPFKFHMGGKTISALLSAQKMTLNHEPVLICSVLDTTELTNATEQLRQAQKMELIGSLAGGIAHDFNNLLTIIKGYTELIQGRELPAELADEVRQIAGAADKAAALTRQLLAFSRRQVLQARNVVMNTVIKNLEPLLRRMIPENIELEFALAADLGTIYADPAQMEQVFMNLVANARDAMRKGGRLRLETANVDISAERLERDVEIPAGRYVVLAVSDTGHGIAPEHLAHIFEPFFTTKEVGRGTGLGLSTVYGIVKQSGGQITVQSEVGAGTTFKIWLPRVERATKMADAKTEVVA